MAISDYLNKLIELKNSLVANLNTMGVKASKSEKMNTLVPKVLNIKKGVSINKYIINIEGSLKYNEYPGNGIIVSTGETNIALYNADYFDISNVVGYSNLSINNYGTKWIVVPTSTSNSYSSTPNSSSLIYLALQCRTDSKRLYCSFFQKKLDGASNEYIKVKAVLSLELYVFV